MNRRSFIGAVTAAIGGLAAGLCLPRQPPRPIAVERRFDEPCLVGDGYYDDSDGLQHLLDHGLVWHRWRDGTWSSVTGLFPGHTYRLTRPLTDGRGWIMSPGPIGFGAPGFSG